MSFWDALFRVIFGGRGGVAKGGAKAPPSRPVPPPAAPPRPPVPQPPPHAGPAPQAPPPPPPMSPPPAAPPPVAPPPVAPPAAPVTSGPPIELGCVDPSVSDQQCAAYVGEVERITRLSLGQVNPGLDKVATKRMPEDAMSIADVQRGLTTLGFFPGGEADGICGYRTLSAIRLFQEYVRTVENHADCVPDGRFGPRNMAHLQRWLSSGQRPNWQARAGEYEAWLGLLNAAKQKYSTQPNREIEKVNAHAGASDTRKVADWDFTGPGAIHLIGIRRKEFSNKFDDIFVLLMKGLVFKFQGSTEPGASSHPQGPPHLVIGQHNYHFGWHQRTYLALRPLGPGVLVLRAGADRRLDEADFARELEPNATINIHWGGRGMAGDVNSWSEGCQVINGSVYINPAHELVDCRGFAAVRSSEPTREASKTRGAYNVLLDLVTALSGDMPNNTVKYTLLNEEDLALAPALAQDMEAARQRVLAMAV